MEKQPAGFQITLSMRCGLREPWFEQTAVCELRRVTVKSLYLQPTVTQAPCPWGGRFSQKDLPCGLLIQSLSFHR